MSRLFTGAAARRITLALAGVGVASAIATGGVATAAPAPAPTKQAPAQTTPVPGTKCTLAGVEKALAKEDPTLWKEIESHPRAKERFEKTIVLTPQQRKHRRQEITSHTPSVRRSRTFFATTVSPRRTAPLTGQRSRRPWRPAADSRARGYTCF